MKAMYYCPICEKSGEMTSTVVNIICAKCLATCYPIFENYTEDEPQPETCYKTR